MNSLLEKAINLAKITKDNIVVINEEKNEGYVIMDFVKYEKLLLEKKAKKGGKSLTEEELVDKINRDIAYSKDTVENKIDDLEKIEEQLELEDSFCDDEDDEDIDEFDEDKDETEEENLYYYNENENTINDNSFSFKSNFVDDKDEGNGWKIPTEIKKGAEEVE